MGWFKIAVQTAEKSSTRGSAGPVTAKACERKLVAEQSRILVSDLSPSQRTFAFYLSHN